MPWKPHFGMGEFRQDWALMLSYVSVIWKELVLFVHSLHEMKHIIFLYFDWSDGCAWRLAWHPQHRMLWKVSFAPQVTLFHKVLQTSVPIISWPPSVSGSRSFWLQPLTETIASAYWLNSYDQESITNSVSLWLSFCRLSANSIIPRNSIIILKCTHTSIVGYYSHCALFVSFSQSNSMITSGTTRTNKVNQSHACHGESHVTDIANMSLKCY